MVNEEEKGINASSTQLATIVLLAKPFLVSHKLHKLTTKDLRWVERPDFWVRVAISYLLMPENEARCNRSPIYDRE